MRIVDLSTSRFASPLLAPFVTALGTVTTVEGVVVRVRDDEGRLGTGEGVATVPITGDTVESIEAALQGPIRAAVIGGRTDELSPLLASVGNAIVGNFGAKAAIDIALHDLWSQWLERPLYRLLGGSRSQVTTDMTISVGSPDEMGAAARRRLAEGFDCLKVKLGGPIELDLARVRAVRSAVGAAASIRVDANQAWLPKEAITVIRRFEDEDLAVMLVEQPVAGRDFEGLAQVTAAVATPIMADESCFTPKDALRLVQGRAADALNVKLMKCGGIGPALEIAAIAASAEIACAVGCMMEGMASSTAAACLAGGVVTISSVDLDAPLWLRDPRYSDVARWSGQDIILGEEPGLGTGSGEPV
ncbi:MAG: dipeptide epimerase [Acidimicrobiales bacterium]